MSENLPPELAYRLHIWWDPIWTIMDKAGLTQQKEIVAAALDAQAQIHTIQANALNQMRDRVLKG